MRFLLPYDTKQILVEIAQQNFAGSLISKVDSYRPDLSQPELVETSLDHPIGVVPGWRTLFRAKKTSSSSAPATPVPRLPKSLRPSCYGGFAQSTDAVERLSSRGERGATWTSEFIPRAAN